MLDRGRDSPHAAARTKPVGAPAWIELGTRDADTARSFYEQALGVTVSDALPEYGGYRNLLVRGEPVAGLMTVQPADPSGWFVYLRTDDVEATTAAVVQHGGSVALPPMDVADLGRMAWITDPSGSLVGLWQPTGFPGTAVESEPGAPSWWELHAPEHYAETVAFYERALGWGAVVIGDTDEFRMVTFGEGRDTWAGVFDAAAAGRSSRGWQVYFAVEDADAAASRIAEAGGTILREPTDTPSGRLVDALDAEGARFSVLQPQD